MVASLAAHSIFVSGFSASQTEVSGRVDLPAYYLTPTEPFNIENCMGYRNKITAAIAVDVLAAPVWAIVLS